MQEEGSLTAPAHSLYPPLCSSHLTISGAGHKHQGYRGLNTFMSLSQGTLPRHKYHFSKGISVFVLVCLCVCAPYIFVFAVCAHIYFTALQRRSSNVLLENCVCVYERVLEHVCLPSCISSSAARCRLACLSDTCVM